MVTERPETPRPGISEKRVLGIACGDYFIARILSQIRQSEVESAPMDNQHSLIARREFLRFLAASPYVAAAGGIGAFVTLPGASAQDLVADAASALNVFDFEEVAHRKVSQGHWAYMASGVDDDATLRANREIFK